MGKRRRGAARDPRAEGIALGDVMAAHQLGRVQPRIMIGPKVFKGIGADMVGPQATQRERGKHRAMPLREEGKRAVDAGDLDLPGARGGCHKR